MTDKRGQKGKWEICHVILTEDIPLTLLALHIQQYETEICVDLYDEEVYWKVFEIEMNFGTLLHCDSPA